ncbi:hypothetical protein ACHAQJ_006141 [Trichoderma viride]
MSAINPRRAPPSHGGLARLVSKFENLGSSSKPSQSIGATYEIRDHATTDSKSAGVPLAREELKDGAAETSKTEASPSLALTSASPPPHNDTAHLASPVKDNHDVNTTAPPSKVGKLVSRRGSVVAEMRRLFERGLEIAPPATYEPKRVASPITTNEYSDHKPSSYTNSPIKGLPNTATLPTEADKLAKPDQQEEKDVVPDLVPFHSHIEHPEYLPRPLASPDRSSSRRSEESGIGIESKKSIWQRASEPRFKLQGGAFLHKTPSPLKNMIVTGIGAWHPKAHNASPDVVPHSESKLLRNDQEDLMNSSLERRERAELDLSENLQPYIPLCHPYQDALSSASTADHAASDPKELHSIKGPSLPTSKSAPSHQSKVSSLRRKFDNSLSSSVSMPSF